LPNRIESRVESPEGSAVLPLFLRRLLQSMCVAVVALALHACARQSPPPSATPAAASAPARDAAAGSASAALRRAEDRYWSDWLAQHPLQATQLGEHRYDGNFPDPAGIGWMADGLAIEQEALEALTAIKPAALTVDEQIDQAAFRRARSLAAAGYRFPEELLPLDPQDDLLGRLLMLGTGQDAQPFRTEADYRTFLRRMDGYVAHADHVVNSLRSGVVKGVTYPRPVVERAIAALAPFAALRDARQTPLWQPLLAFPAGLSVTQRKALTADYRRTIDQQLLPACRRLHTYLSQEYLAQARTTFALSELPSGELWYAQRVSEYTGTTLTPLQVHELGLQEVARWRAEAEQLARLHGHAGDPRAYFEALRADSTAYAADPASLLGRYADVERRVAAALPLLFAAAPAQPAELRSVEPLRRGLAPALEYRPQGLIAERRARLYVNTGDLAARPTYLIAAAYLREAVPGRHLQQSIAAAQTSRSGLLRFGSLPAHAAGWALYAQSLGRELGIYNDAYSIAGDVMTQLWMAARVVTDTGLHAKGWSRDQAIAYLRSNSGLTEREIAADVDLSLASPGSVLAPKMGQLQISALRQHAQQRLGARFDVRAFHAQLLAAGPAPWPELGQRIDRWIDVTRTH